MSEAQLGDVVAAAIKDGVRRLARNQALLRSDESQSEAVHQTRVATRRLRSDLRTFRSALDARWSAQLRAELAWLAGSLAAARDADVLWQRLAGDARELAPERARGAIEVMAVLADRRARAHAALLETLQSERHRALMERLAQAAQAPALAGDGGCPAPDALPHVMRDAWRALESRASSLTDRPSDAELHSVRIRAKRCRYAAEACIASLGKPARRLARATSSLQEVLGELNDAVVTERWLRDWAEHADSASAALAAGELAALERAAASRARSRWPKAWSRVASVAPARGHAKP